MNVVFAASEVTPFAKTGGLAEVIGSLPRALAERGHRCAVMLPFYRSARNARMPIESTEHTFDVPIAAKRVRGQLCRSRLPDSDVPVYLVEQPDYFERDDPDTGRGIYQFQTAAGERKDYPDNCERFVFFNRAVLEALPRIGFRPDILHCNDWQTGLIPVYLREHEAYRSSPNYARTRSLFTLHNVAYQGLFWHWDMDLTGLDWRLFNWEQLEFYGYLSLLKAGIVFADAVSTVSPRYAEEIQTPRFGYQLSPLLRHYKDKLAGIVNGLDDRSWDPATDPHLPSRYDVETVATGKAACKAALQRDFQLPERPSTPVLGIVARLEDQKLGLLKQPGVGDALLGEDVQLVLLGTGQSGYYFLFNQWKKKHPDKVGVAFRFDEAVAHQIEAGADIFLMPSAFEPSGLNQLYSLKYGTVPLVHDTGGLHDTVTDYSQETLASGAATGFMFRDYTAEAFLRTLRRALGLYRHQPDNWLKLVRNGMRQDWSWRHSAQRYEELYRAVLGPGVRRWKAEQEGECVARSLRP